MHAEPSPPQVVLSFLILVTFGGMAVTLFQAGRRLFRGEPLVEALPDGPRRARWGWASVGLVLLLALAVVPAAAIRSYEAARATFHVRVGPPRPKAAAHGKAGKAEKAAPPAPAPAGLIRDEARFTFTEQMFLVSVVNVVLIPLLPLVLRLTSGATPRDLGLTAEHGAADARLGLVAFLAVTPCVMAINLLAVLVWRPMGHPLEGMLREGLTPFGVVLAYVSAVVLAPVAEEIIFRGVLQGWLERLELRPKGPGPAADPSALAAADLLPGPAPSAAEEVPPPPARRPSALPIVMTSLVFAIVHAPQMPAPIAIFFLSLALGGLARARRSLVAPIVLHAAFNGFNTTLMVFALSLPASKQDIMKKADPPPAAVENGVGQGVFDWRSTPGLLRLQ